MTELELLQYIGATDETYIMESCRRLRKRPAWKRYMPAAAAACGALVILCGGAALALKFFGNSGRASQAAEGVLSAADAEELPGGESQDTALGASETDSAIPDVSAYGVTLLAGAVYPEAAAYDDYEAQSQQWTENQVTDETRYAVNAFAYSTASKVLQNQEKSGCYSPLSLYQTLSILASGASGQTCDELLSLLGQGDLDTLADQAGKLYRVNYADDEVTKLKIANSLWLDETMEDGSPIAFRQDWVLSAAANYYADVYQAEFSGADTPKALGTWIAENTGGFLQPQPEELGLSDETVMAIVNTLWFKTSWASQFAAEETEAADFTGASGETVSCDFMHRTDDMGQCVETEEYTKSYLSLNQGRMIFVLPGEGVDVGSLLSEEKLWEIFENGEYQSARVRWSVPKFETSVTCDLKESLEALGISSAFSPDDADFSAMSDAPLYLGRIQQGTHISVNEDGVEAAAYTSAGMEAGVAFEEAPLVEMNLNRPFIYLITANDGSTLFMGVVRSPSE